MQTFKPTSRVPSTFWKTDDNLESFFRQLTRRFAPSVELRTGGYDWMPSVEITENDAELMLTAELPGLEKKDIEIELLDDMLVLRGNKEDKREKKDERYRVWERWYGSFERAFTLPPTVDSAQIKAEMKNGVLTVRVPKLPVPEAKRIDIA